MAVPDDAPPGRTGTRSTGAGIVELRQYTCVGGRRDELIELFERELQDPLEHAGMRVLGTFRDADDADRFVWLRSFPDTRRRLASLTAFYSSPTWLARRDAANATMLDSDNVLLLEALHGDGARRPYDRDAHAQEDAPFVAYVHALAGVAAADLHGFLRRAWWPRLAACGAQHVLSLATCSAANDYPRLPVREGEHVLVVLARWPSLESEADAFARFARAGGWRDGVDAALLPALMRKPERLRLMPTARSALR